VVELFDNYVFSAVEIRVSGDLAVYGASQNPGHSTRPSYNS
jgi:hypothetical protein